MKHPNQQFDVDDYPLLALFDRKGMVVRLFSRVVDDQTLQFPKNNQSLVIDSTSKSTWSLTGQALHGKLKGKQLSQEVSIMSFKKAWDDFHPQSKSITFE